ncbi:MAG: hypothetical protein KF773_26765 [Deltaproteobacteria bacterium]|nr:hypothetical protein [Deltaproteobacteria bacterium]
MKGRSGNPAGRPKGFAGVAARIMAETRDGAELVEWALAVWRDAARSHRERAEAHAWLSDRGLGKAVATVELHASLASTTRDEDDAFALQLDGLSIEQLEQLEALEAERARILAGVGARLQLTDGR